MFVTCAMLQSIAVEWPEDKHDQLPGRLCCAVCSFGSTGNFARLQQSFCFLHLGLQNIVGCGLGLGAWKLLLLERSICGWSGQQRPAAASSSLCIFRRLFPHWRWSQPGHWSQGGCLQMSPDVISNLRLRSSQ